MDWKEVKQFYHSFNSEETGQTLDSIRLVTDNSLRDKSSPNSKSQGKIPNSLCLHLIKYKDMKHEKKEVSLPRDIKLAPKYYAVYCSKHALSQSMLDIGLYYKPNKLKVRNNNVARLEKIRD